LRWIARDPWPLDAPAAEWVRLSFVRAAALLDHLLADAGAAPDPRLADHADALWREAAARCERATGKSVALDAAGAKGKDGANGRETLRAARRAVGVAVAALHRAHGKVAAAGT
jgi:hypothetical protein